MKRTNFAALALAALIACPVVAAQGNPLNGLAGAIESAIAGAPNVDAPRYSNLGQAAALAIDEDHKLTASDATSGDNFGVSVSLSDDRALVGSWLNGDGGSDSGSAYVFDFDGASWSQTSKLTASDAADNDWFGSSVSLSGDRALVGSYGDDNVGSSSGSAYVFDLTTCGVACNEVSKLTASDEADYDFFGYPVSLSGDRALIGSSGDDDGSGNSGSAYVFDLIACGAACNEVSKLTASDAAASDWFGISVSLSGDQALVGARYDDEGGYNSGSAYVFDLTTCGAACNEVAKLTASDAIGGENFGISVSLSGGRALVGAHRDDDGGNHSGSAYVFDFDGASWGQTSKLTASDAAEFDFFGWSVSLSGDGALVGSHLDDDDGNESGSAYVFDLSTCGAACNEVSKLTASDAAVEDWFGYSVSLSGDRALVGLYLDDDDGDGSGSAYVFDLDTGPVGVEPTDGAPGTHVLTQAYPNPFNPEASFSLTVAVGQHVEVSLFNALGQEVATLFSGQLAAGQARAITINGENLPSGVYHYRAIGETFSDSGQVTLLK